MIGADRIRLRSPHSRWLGRHRQVEAAVLEHRRGERSRDPVTVAQPQQRGRGQVAARRVAADRERPAGADRVAALVAEQPQRRRLAVVGPGGIRVLGRQPVADADHGQPGVVGQALEPSVLQVLGADHPAAAVDVQERAGRARVRGRSPGARSGRAGRRSRACVPRGTNTGAGKIPQPFAPRAPALRGRNAR